MKKNSFSQMTMAVALAAVVCGAGIVWFIHQHKVAAYASACRQRAEKEDAEAQFRLASLYYQGRGVPQNYAEAARWYRKSAEQGYAESQTNLAFMYYEGKGVPQNYLEAVKWYRKGAELGNAKAQNGLAFAYYQGNGVAQDYVEAVYWYRKAAERGDATSEKDLGLMYYRGRGVAQDYVQAAQWYWKAAEQGNASAQYDLGYMYDTGKGLPRDKAAALRWYREAALQGEPSAESVLLSRSTVSRYLDYTWLIIGLTGSVWLLVNSARNPRGFRSWEQRALMLLGLLGIAYVAITIFGKSHYMQYSSYGNTFYMVKGLLMGMLIVIFVVVIIMWSGKYDKPERVMVPSRLAAALRGAGIRARRFLEGPSGVTET